MDGWPTFLLTYGQQGRLVAARERREDAETARDAILLIVSEFWDTRRCDVAVRR